MVRGRGAFVAMCVILLPLGFGLTIAGAEVFTGVDGNREEAFTGALTLFFRGDYESACSEYRTLLPENPKQQDPVMCYAAGQCERAAGNYDQAMAWFLQAADASDQPIAEASLLKAAEICHEDLREPQRAAGFYREVLKRHETGPRAATALIGLGGALEAMGRFDEAKDAYRRARAPRGLRERNGEGCYLAMVGASRARQIDEGRQSDFTPLKMYYDASRRASGKTPRPEAFVTLVRMAGLYPESALVDDAFVQLVRVHLLRGDEQSARQAFGRLVRSRPRTVPFEPLRGIALRMAGWLLEGVDQEIASESEVFPELAGYRAGENLEFVGEGDSAGWHLRFASKSQPGSGRSLEVHVAVSRPAAGAGPTYPNLALGMTLEIRTQSDLLRAEVRRAVSRLEEVLAMLDRAAAVTFERGNALVGARCGFSGTRAEKMCLLTDHRTSRPDGVGGAKTEGML